MKPILPIAMICLLTLPVFAQRGGGGGGRGMGGMGGGRGMMGGGFRGRPGFGGGFHRGFGGGGFNRFNRFRPGFNRFGFNNAFFGFGSGLGWGLGWGGGWGGGWGDYGYPFGYPSYGPSGSTVTVVYPPPAPPTVVTVFADAARSVIRENDWSDSDWPPGSSGSPIYLIALLDGRIFAASSYRVVAGSLQFVTVHGEEKQTPVESVDRAMTTRLNRERRVRFQLPE
jgi:hypothetical protein